MTSNAGGAGTATATYDALGRMVEAVTGSTNTQFVYSPLGTQYAVVQNGTLSRGTVPLPGGDTAVYNSAGLNYIRRMDLLGSSRLATTWAHAVYSKEAYAPYGEPYYETGTPDRSFTGQSSDLTGNKNLYDFQFRKLDATAGRWLSPDPYGWNAVDPRDPQTLNRYAYVRNSPLSSVDPLGLDEISIITLECTRSLITPPIQSEGYGSDVEDGVPSSQSCIFHVVFMPIGTITPITPFVPNLNFFSSGNGSGSGSGSGGSAMPPAPNKPPTTPKPDPPKPQEQKPSFSPNTCFYLDWGMSYVGGLSLFTAIQPEAAIVSVPLGAISLVGWGVAKIGGC